MTDPHRHDRHTTHPAPRAHPAPHLLAGTAIAAAVVGIVLLTARAPEEPDTPSVPSASLAVVNRPDLHQRDTAAAQAFADRISSAFAAYLSNPQRTRALRRLGVPLAMLATHAPAHDRDANRRTRAHTPRADGAARSSSAFVVESAQARRTVRGWLLTASLVSGRSTGRTVVPLVATADRSAGRWRVTSLNGPADTE